MNNRYHKARENVGKLVFKVDEPCRLLDFLLLNVKGSLETTLNPFFHTEKF